MVWLKFLHRSLVYASELCLLIGREKSPHSILQDLGNGGACAACWECSELRGRVDNLGLNSAEQTFAEQHKLKLPDTILI